MLDKRTKNILFYEPSSGFGGSAVACLNVVNNLNKELFFPILAIRNFGPQFDKIKNVARIKLRPHKEQDKISNIGLLLYYVRNIIPDIIKIYLCIKAKKISLVHINTNIISGIPAIIAAKLSGVNCVCHIRQTRRLIKREKIFLSWVDKFIVLNKNAYDMYKQDIPDGKLILVYDGIDLNTFSRINTDFRQEFNLDSSPSIGLVGRIVKGKGHKEFILAAKEVLKNMPQVKFVIVGDAKGDSEGYYREVKELVKNEQLEKSIIFSGWRDDVENVILGLDVLVQATTTFPEGFGLTIIEAMSLGKPVVATNIPGPRDIVIDGETGFLVSPSDIKLMAEKIMYLLNNPEIAKKMGEKGRRRAKEAFDIRETVRKIEEVYQDVLDNRGSREIKRSVKYNLQRIIDFLIQPINIAKMHNFVKSIENNKLDILKKGSYICIEDLFTDAKQYEMMKEEVDLKGEYILGIIDQDGRLLSFAGIIPYFDNIAKNQYISRVRYKLGLTVINCNGNYAIAVKKDFGKDKSSFTKEAFVLYKLNLCNVPRIIKVNTRKNTIYMSFVPGISLREALAGRGAKVRDSDYEEIKVRDNLSSRTIKDMKFESAKAIISEVTNNGFIEKLSRQLDVVHSQGIILEDIKYGNIIIGMHHEPFFIDFHSAKIINPRSLRGRLLINQENRAFANLFNIQGSPC